MNFFVNKAIGESNSGVEHAQFYRAHCFREKKIEFKFIFTDLLPQLHHHMQLWSLPENEVIGLYDLLLSDNPDRYAKTGLTEINEYSTNSLWDLTNTQRTIVHQTTGQYTETIFRSKSYSEAKKLFLIDDDRVILKNGIHEIMWHYRDSGSRGKIATNIHLRNFRGKNYVFSTKEALIDFFFIEMQHIFQKNIYFLDRGTACEESLVRLKRIGLPLKIVDMIHAEHLVTYQGGHPLWNNYYQYMFDHLDDMDLVVTATQLQAETIKKQLTQMNIRGADKICAVPVGGVAKLENPRRWHGGTANFVTASRLHPEKNILQIIKAIKKLRDEGMDVTLAIYGSGNEKENIQRAIAELDLQFSVHLKGLSQDIIHDFQKYDAFVSASYSEGFGLTYIEAIGDALPIATYANLYGAQELVCEGVNGCLADFDRDKAQERANISNLADAMRRIFDNYDHLSVGAHKKAQEYQTNNIADQWQKICEVLI